MGLTDVEAERLLTWLLSKTRRSTRSQRFLDGQAWYGLAGLLRCGVMATAEGVYAAVYLGVEPKFAASRFAPPPIAISLLPTALVVSVKAF
jgi:hypothetical protein